MSQRSFQYNSITALSLGGRYAAYRSWHDQFRIIETNNNTVGNVRRAASARLVSAMKWEGKEQNNKKTVLANNFREEIRGCSALPLKINVEMLILKPEDASR